MAGVGEWRGRHIRTGHEGQILPPSPASTLTGIHTVQGTGHTIQVLEEVVIIDVLCVKAHMVLTARHADVWI